MRFVTCALFSSAFGLAHAASLTRRAGGIDANGQVELLQTEGSAAEMAKSSRELLQTISTLLPSHSDAAMKQLHDLEDIIKSGTHADPDKIKIIKDLVENQLIPDLMATRDSAAAQNTMNLKAIEACGKTAVDSTKAKAASLQKSVDGSRTMHSGCRSTEISKHAEKKGACSFLDSALSGAPGQYFKPEKTGDGDGEEDSMLEYLKKMNEFYCPKAGEITKCETAKTDYSTQKGKCDHSQEQFESNNCAAAVATNEACEAISSTCYADTKKVYDQHVAATKALVATWKTEYAAMKKISCFVDVWLSDGDATTVNNTKFASCKTTDADTSKIDIDYGTPAGKFDCAQLKPQVYPGSADFVSTEYANFKDYVKEITVCTALKGFGNHATPDYGDGDGDGDAE